MDGELINARHGTANDDMRLLNFAVTSTHLTQAEIVQALGRSGATARLDTEGVIAEIPADSAGNILSRMFTCHFLRRPASQAI